ncbi:glycosyltransferase [Novosphingobium sp. FSY-8]|uniref:Glycosyltransferase n=1 Tax=Novosphingobium ovatum TaxID=1908523 RepID=A0ABW9XCZ5_9SPHN|nr:glycosyltransferase [Novosphingobium ovatum]NBC36367.1 glycosyltransferase [Novosphingobium ovatum]
MNRINGPFHRKLHEESARDEGGERVQGGRHDTTGHSADLGAWAQGSPARVAFVLPSLARGGAEIATLHVARGFARRGVAVDLVIVANLAEEIAPPEGVRLIRLNAPRLLSAIAPLRRYIRNARPQALFAAIWPLTVVAALAVGLVSRARRPRLMLTHHSALLPTYGRNWRSRIKLFLTTRLTYRWADWLVGVSCGVTREIIAISGLAPQRAVTVFNPVPKPEMAPDTPCVWPPRAGPRILTVGNLRAPKNQRLLIDAFALLSADAGATLAIVGEGPERPALEAQIATAGLTGRVLLPGSAAEPGAWFRDADLFVLSSDMEGFGNVLVEAMHFGLPVVATDCPYGPHEVLQEGALGHLTPVGDAAALARAMTSALEHPVDRAALRQRAGQFATPAAVAAYWALACADVTA